MLGSTLYEHKQFLQPFARAFPRARVLCAPGQWSWPLNLPLGVARAEEIDDDGAVGLLPPELECATLDLPPVGLNTDVRFSEVALYHRPTRTLMVTDAVMRLDARAPPPTVSARDLLEWADDRNIAITGLRLLRLFGVEEASQRYGLLRAKERPDGEAQALGWQRMALTSLYFGQADVLRPRESFERLSERALVVPPVVGVVVYGDGEEGGVADDVSEWAERVARWPFERVAPAHFAVARATPREWREAFSQWRAAARAVAPGGGRSSAQGGIDALVESLASPLRGIADALGGAGSSSREYYPAADAQCLRDVRQFLIDLGIIFTEDTRPPRPQSRGGTRGVPRR